MATLEEQEYLVKLLAFKPTSHFIKIWGWGGEYCIGNISEKTYNYFIENKISVSDYANDFEDCKDVPEELQPFPSGYWYDCDDILHEGGPEIDSSTVVEITDAEEQVVWRGDLSIKTIEDAGISYEFTRTIDFDELQNSPYIFTGFSGEKGLFFDGEIELESPFDIKKLKINIANVDGYFLLSEISYNGEDLITDDYDTVGKSLQFELMKIGPEGVEETYSEPEIEEAE